MMEQPYSAWVEVDRSALAHNFGQVRELVGPEVKILAVVKAGAYGHGAVETSRVFLAAGADYLGVTRLEEALELREGGITAPVLIFSAGIPTQAESIIAHDFTQTVCTVEMARALSEAAGAAARTARIHVKVDSGMGRIGVLPGALLSFLKEITALPHLEIEGFYTHFATALDKRDAFLRKQLRTFLRVSSEAKKAGLCNPLLHAANSGALLRFEASRLDMVRPGTILYGQYPGPHLPRLLDLHETWQLKGRVSFVKTVHPGDTIGYGRDFTARRTMTVATIPLGYCDGLTLASVRTARNTKEFLGVLRAFLRRNKMGVRIHGHFAPFVGRVSMQMCCVDVSHIPNVQVGDEAILPARRTLTSSRLPRVYIDSGK